MACVELSLLCNISFDSLGGDANCGDEVSIRPNTVSTPVVFLEDGKLLLDTAGGVGFEEANRFPYRHLWWDGNEEVYMVYVMIGLLEVKLWVMSGDFHQFPVEVLPEFGSDDRMTVFGRIDDVVITEVDAVAVSPVFMWLGHPFIVS